MDLSSKSSPTPGGTCKKSGRRGRAYTPEQYEVLWRKFLENPLPSSKDPNEYALIAAEAGLVESQCRVWFQNTRSRSKSRSKAKVSLTPLAEYPMTVNHYVRRPAVYDAPALPQPLSYGQPLSSPGILPTPMSQPPMQQSALTPQYSHPIHPSMYTHPSATPMVPSLSAHSLAAQQLPQSLPPLQDPVSVPALQTSISSNFPNDFIHR
ncbi:hypothetical protein GEMRC1_003503 [Eukaryota sp. GEM-RC1]